MLPATVLRVIWEHNDVDPNERKRIVSRFNHLEVAGCPAAIALRGALDEWLQRLAQQDLDGGREGSYLQGDHWLRLGRVARLLAGGQCEGWRCESGRDLEGHHLHYMSVGRESLFEVCVLCDRCHERLHWGEEFYAGELVERRQGELEELEAASRRIASG